MNFVKTDNINNSSIIKILFLYKLLLENDKSKNEIIEEFKKNNTIVNKPTINRYIKVLINHGVNVKILKNKNENIYSIPKQNKDLILSDKQLQIIKNIKKSLALKKDYNLIRRTMRLFYKIALYIDNKSTIEQFIDFGYYSTINWKLALTLEKHATDRDIIIIEYILADNTKQDIEIQADSLSISNHSNRLYLNGIIKGTNKLSHLPVDKIFVIKKVVQKQAPFNLITKTVQYTISRELFAKIEKDDKEKIISKNDNYITLERIVDDDFFLIQRLLYFCPDLYYISDDDIKNKVMEKLTDIEKLYETK